MKTLTDILADAVRSGIEAQADADHLGWWDIDGGTLDTREFSVAKLAAHVAAAYRDARTITDTMHLEALPEGAIVRDADEWVFAFNSDQWWTVLSSGVGGGEPGGECLTSAVALPALVLWLPEEVS